jgi:hypothetical protein
LAGKLVGTTFPVFGFDSSYYASTVLFVITRVRGFGDGGRATGA